MVFISYDQSNFTENPQVLLKFGSPYGILWHEEVLDCGFGIDDSAHDYLGFLTAKQLTSCIDKWTADKVTFWTSPDLSTLRVDTKYRIIEKVGGKWRFGKAKPNGTTYAVFSQIYLKDKTHPVAEEYGADIHFTIWNGRFYRFTLLCP